MRPIPWLLLPGAAADRLGRRTCDAAYFGEAEADPWIQAAMAERTCQAQIWYTR